MAEISLKLNKSKVTNLFVLIGMMAGSASFRLLRQQIREELKEKWPELEEKDLESQVSDDEVRILKLDGRQQRALAEGFLELINRHNPQTGGTLIGLEFESVMKVVKECRLSKWVKDRIEKADEVQEFDGVLDDEISLVDSEEEII